jgi:hypothetical protein
MYSLFGPANGRKSPRKSGRKSPRKSRSRSPARASSRSRSRSRSRSPSQRAGARKSPRKSSKVGSRASVARSHGAKHTPGGLSLGNGLFRGKDGRIKSVKASKAAKSKFAKTPALKERSALVKKAFAAVKAVKKSGQKTNARGILKAPNDAILHPSRYVR